MTTGNGRRPADVRIAALRKRFGRHEVLRGVEFRIAAGRITAVVGPNAAGKSTLLKAIVGLVRLRPGEGGVTIDGAPVGTDFRYRERIGYMPQAGHFPEHLTGREVLHFLRELRGHPADVDLDLLERFQLGPALEQPVRTLSEGTKQKLNAVVAFLFRPSLLILDEPTAGLDPVASAVLKDKVRDAPSQGATVILTSHIMSEIEELAQDVVFLVEGQVQFQGPVDSLTASTGETRLERAMVRLLGARP